MKLSTAILTGGKSSRMGRNKAFLPYKGTTFLQHLQQELETFDQVLISAADSETYKDFSNVITDQYPEAGPLSGIYTCLENSRNQYLFVCAVDMPFITKELVHFMVTYLDSNAPYQAYVIKTDDRLQPLCAIYHQSALPIMKEQLGSKNYRLMDLLTKLEIKTISLTYTCFNENITSNINTPTDYSNIRKCPSIFAVCGKKNTGKTTLITKMVQSLKTKGLRVGIIKHDGHDFTIDHAGTDTSKFRAAGSDGTIIYSKTQLALMKTWEKPDLNGLIALLSDMDLIILEGQKHGDFPKIEVVDDKPIATGDQLLAVATDSGYVHPTVPTFSRNDVDSLLEIIWRWRDHA